MATPALTPSPAQGPQPGPQASPTPGGAGMGVFARIAQQAQEATQQFPEAAPMMREVANQCRLATMKAIQQRSQPQGPTPQI